MNKIKPWLKTNDVTLTSRLLIGTEQYGTSELIRDITIASGSVIIDHSYKP